MDTTNLQIPIRKDLKIAATEAALEQGFSSLQEAVRLFVHRIADRTVRFTFTEEKKLSTKAEKQYLKMIKDLKTGKNWHKADSLEDFLKQLDS